MKCTGALQASTDIRKTITPIGLELFKSNFYVKGVRAVFKGVAPKLFI